MGEAGVSGRCDGCGLAIDGGAAGCLALYQATFVLPGDIPTWVGPGRLAFDTYCFQHPDCYCISAKSLAAHLGGLCWALEGAGTPEGYARLRRALDGPGRFPKPALPAARGAPTIADVAAAPDPAVRAGLIRDWARAVWDAHADLHAWARERVAAADARR
jgi:hypothetical protein